MKARRVAPILLVLMVTLLTGCIGGSSSTGTIKTDEELAKNQVKKLLEGYRQLDATAMGEVVAPIIEFTGTDALGHSISEQHTREKFVAGFQGMFDESGLFPEDWVPPTYGPLKSATVGSNIVVTMDVLSEDETQPDTWAFTLVKSSGKWLISKWYIDAYRDSR